jgi:hypothetical protein
MVDWLCARRRDVRAGEEVLRSLKRMGATATIPLLETLRKAAPKRCRADLLNVLSRIDTGNHIDASMAMVASLPKQDPGTRQAILISLARSMPTLPPDAIAILAAMEKGKDRVQSLLARWVIDGKPSKRVPPSDLAAALASGNEEAYMLESARQWLQWRRPQLEGPEPYIRLEAVEQAGDLGAYGVGAVAIMIPVLLADEAPMVREAAADALGLIGSSKALAALNQAKQSGLPKIAKRAELAIDRIVKSNTGELAR